MLKLFYTAFLLTALTSSYAQDLHQVEIKKWQEEHDAEFADSEKSPLEKKDLKKFKGLDYFPIDAKYRVTATFMLTPNEAPFSMPTSTSRLPLYAKYGIATFTIDGQNFSLPLYKSQDPFIKEEYKNHLFLPFTDLTNGKESYGGGRYIDMTIPEGDTLVIDFNKSYNPYCAYSGKYSCPIPPKDNFLNTEIKAGVMTWKEH